MPSRTVGSAQPWPARANVLSRNPAPRARRRANGARGLQCQCYLKRRPFLPQKPATTQTAERLCISLCACFDALLESAAYSDSADSSQAPACASAARRRQVGSILCAGHAQLRERARELVCTRKRERAEEGGKGQHLKDQQKDVQQSGHEETNPSQPSVSGATFRQPAVASQSAQAGGGCRVRKMLARPTSASTRAPRHRPRRVHLGLSLCPLARPSRQVGGHRHSARERVRKLHKRSVCTTPDVTANRSAATSAW